MSDEPTYTRRDRLNAAFVLLVCAAIGAVSLDVLFDLTGRWRARKVGAEAEAHVAAQAAAHD